MAGVKIKALWPTPVLYWPRSFAGEPTVEAGLAKALAEWLRQRPAGIADAAYLS